MEQWLAKESTAAFIEAGGWRGVNALRRHA